MKRTLARMGGLIALALFAIAVYYVWDNLREYSVPERVAVVLHQEDRRDIGNELRRALNDPEAEVRMRAVLAVGRIGGSESGPLLMEALSDGSLDVASAAAFAIGLTDRKELAEQLLEESFDMPSVIATQAVTSAGRLADSSMTQVTDWIADHLVHPSPDVRRAAALGLFYAGAKDKGHALISFVRKENDDQARAAGIFALARMRIGSAEDVFIDFLADSDPFVRICCIRGLGASENPEAVRHMAVALNDGDQNVVIEAMSRLGRVDSQKARDYLARKLDPELPEHVLVTLIEAMQVQENPAGVEILGDLIFEEPSAWVTAAIAKYLAVQRKDRAVPLLDSLVYDGVPLVREGCAEAFALIDDEKMVPRLAILFADEDPRVRASAFEGLLKLDSANAPFYVEKGLSDTDLIVIATAMDQVGERLMAQFLPRLIAMSGGRDTIDIDIRRSLVGLAETFLSKDQNDTTAHQLLLGGALDYEYLVRRGAAEVYKSVLGEDRDEIVRRPRTRISVRDLTSAIENYQVNPLAIVTTSRGEIEMELFFDVAPLTVLNFVELAKKGFYEGLPFHRIVPGFVVQGGCPRGDGWGGPPWTIRCEYSPEPYLRGTVGIATSGKDSGGSQFFITLAPQPHLEARYTVVGYVTAGMDVADRLIPGDLIEKITIVQERR